MHEASDIDRAIERVAEGRIDFKPFISSVNDLPDIGAAVAGMDGNPAGMKALFSCGDANS